MASPYKPGNPYRRKVYDFAPPYYPSAPTTTPELQPLLDALLNPPEIQPVALLMLTANVSTTPIVILTNRPNRQYFLLQNLTASASTVLVTFGINAASGNGFEIIAGGSIELQRPCTSDFVSVVCASGSASIVFCEG